MSDNAREREGREELDITTVQFVLKEAKDLIRSLEGTAISKIRIQSGALQIEVERGGGGAMVPMAASTLATNAPATAVSAAPGVMPVVAPLIGVFYRSPTPGAKPFVEVGDTVERGQQVGIIEAMKVMNEVVSDYRGTVVEVLVENGEAVQYEQPLMQIDTAGSRE